MSQPINMPIRTTYSLIVGPFEVAISMFVFLLASYTLLPDAHIMIHSIVLALGVRSGLKMSESGANPYILSILGSILMFLILWSVAESVNLEKTLESAYWTVGAIALGSYWYMRTDIESQRQHRRNYIKKHNSGKALSDEDIHEIMRFSFKNENKLDRHEHVILYITCIFYLVLIGFLGFRFM